MTFDWYGLAIVAICVLVNLLLRFIPFFAYGKKDKISEPIEYFGKVLPYSMMTMILVYCLKDVSFSALTGWLPALIGVVVTAGLQIWKRNSIISVVAGTVIYMIMLRII